MDPSVIPLGSTVYIEGVGARRAEDTGGNIKGNTIDIYMNTESQCRSWGVRYVTDISNKKTSADITADVFL